MLTPAPQNFECRDCPARCCTAPWRLVIQEEEKKRFESEAWIRERFARHGVAIQPLGGSDHVVPYIVRGRSLQCVFLDDDNLCSMYKRHGREFWPSVCRSFPFEFITDDEGVTQPVLSQYCPSIRDNYGIPVTPERLEGFLADSAGRLHRLSPVQHLGVQTRLRPAQYLQLTKIWLGLIQGTPSLAEGLFACHQVTDKLELELLEQTDVDDAAWLRALESAQGAPREALSATPPEKRESHLLPNLVLGLQLSNLAWPIRSYIDRQFSVARLLPTWATRMKLIRESGPIDLLLIPEPFRLEEAAKIPAILNDSVLAERVRRFLADVLQRRYYLRLESTMAAHLFQLILGCVTLLRFARYHAAARGAARVESIDLREGIGAAELLVAYHSYPPGPILGGLNTHFSSNTLSLRKLLLSEI